MTGRETPNALRLGRLRALAEDTGTALIYGLGASFQYFTGCILPWQRENEPSEPSILMLTVPGAEPLVLVDEISQPQVEVVHSGALPVEVFRGKQALAGLFRERLHGTKRVGANKSAKPYFESLVRSLIPGATFLDGDPGEPLRVIKSAGEIETIRRAVELTDEVMKRVLPEIRPGVSQNQLRAMIRDAGLNLGAQDTSFAPAALYVKSGTEPTADPFVYPRDEALVPGTSIAFDFGFVLDGYCSDFGRSFYCGRAPEHIHGAYRALQESLQELYSQMKPGKVKLNQLFGIIEAALDRRGYGDKLRARLKDGALGHQIGVDLHENPWLRPHADVLLEPGMVMAVEPKLWHAGEYYLRVEDIVLITEDGAESLTGFDRDTFELEV